MDKKGWWCMVDKIGHFPNLVDTNGHTGFFVANIGHTNDSLFETLPFASVIHVCEEKKEKKGEGEGVLVGPYARRR